MSHAALAPVAAVARVGTGSTAARHHHHKNSLASPLTSSSSLRSSRRRGSLVTVAAFGFKKKSGGNVPFPVGTPDANGIVPGVGKGMPKWPEVWEWLNYEKKMETLDSAEAVNLMKKGAVLLDVRFEPDYEKWSVPGSVHVPYVTGGILAKMRLPGFKKKNTDFVSQVEEAIPDKNTKIILACIWGGSLGKERSGAGHA